MEKDFLSRMIDCIKNKLSGFTECLRKGCDPNAQGNDSFRSKCNSFSGKCYENRYKIFKCPECKQKLRVPRGKGRIQITCRRCQHEFIKRT